MAVGEASVKEEAAMEMLASLDEKEAPGFVVTDVKEDS